MRSLNKFLSVASLLFLAVIYQNFDWNALFQTHIRYVDQESRAEHAKEIFGKKYNGSLAHKAETISDLHVTLYQEVRNSLPEKYKGEAMNVTNTVLKVAEKYKFDPIFILAVIQTESRFNPKARGFLGEIGLMQVKPCTAEWFAKKAGLNYRGSHTLENPSENIKIGTAYMSYMRSKFAKKPQRYVAAYNMGAANVMKNLKKNAKKTEFVYSEKVLANYKMFYNKFITKKLTMVVASNDHF